MAKRFTSTEIWDEDWFLEMPAEYKLFWYYMLSSCNHAGLFRVNVKKFSSLNDVKVTPQKALDCFNKDKSRIRVITDALWLIEDFFVFQYGSVFNPNNKVHESIEKAYNQANINMTSIRGLTDLKERDKDKDKDKDRKGGLGEKHKTGIYAEKIEDGFAYFHDGSSQKLSLSQQSLLAMNELKPSEIHKNNQNVLR